MRISRKTLLAVSAALMFAISHTAFAETGGAEPGTLGEWGASTTRLARSIWDNGATEVYLPVHTYHMRWAYSAEKVRTLNENPWGFGVGKTLVDEHGNEHRLYAMVFKDSHFQLEPIAGYARLWQVASKGPFRLKAGLTFFVTSRGDTMHYMPFPAALPLVSMNVGRLSLMSTYIPGGRRSGNVLFTFASYQLGQ